MVKQFFYFIFILLISSLLSGCLFYDYGVDKSETKLPYRTYYFGEKDKKHDFTTVLYSVDKKPKGAFNYINFNVSIAHMYKESQTEHKGKYISKILFSDFTTEDDIHLIPESIKLVHKDKHGKVIVYEKIEHDLTRKSKTKYRNHFYKKIYSPEVLPSELNEFIYIEVNVKGVLEIIEYKLPIKKTLHYTWWDVMMGV